MPDDPTVTYLIYPFVLLLIVSPNFFRIYGLIALALVYTVSYSQDLTSLSSRWLIWGLFGVFLTLLVALSPAQLFFTKEEQRDPIQHIEVLHPSLHGEKMSAGAEVDIVAIHGLGSSPDRAWVHKATNAMWLRDFLPKDIPEARIMTFNHDSNWVSSALEQSLKDYAQTLLSVLEGQRVSYEEKERPIIFIAHSFGGILIKQVSILSLKLFASRPNKVEYQALLNWRAMINQALVTAARRGRPIKDFVKGIIFLGTPHGGSSLALAGKLQALGTYWLGSRTELLELLEPHSKQNKQLHEDYLEYLEAHQGVYHYDFWENLSEKWWGFPIGMAVNKAASTIPGKFNEPLTCTHRHLNKFKSPDDPNYHLVRIQLKEACRRAKPKKELVDSQDILNWVSPIQVSRQHNGARNKAAIENPGAWILAEKKFQDWDCSKVSSFLWLRGEIGTGKTILTSTVIEHEINCEAHGGVIAYLYCSGTSELLRDPDSILRSILQQLANTERGLEILRPEWKARLRKSELDRVKTKQLIVKLIGLYGDNPTIIILDALDEVADRHILLVALREIQEKSKGLVKIFISSRPDRNITSRGSWLEMQLTPEKTIDDIHRFIEKEVDERLESRADVAIELVEEVKQNLKQRANGMFRWVEMAVQYVCAPNRKAAHIRSALNELPDNLAGVYEMLLSRIEGEVPGNKVLAIKTITWLLTAKKSLPTFILIHAVCMNSTERPEETSPDDILFACHHLVTLNKLTDRFEFGHFSVVEFLMTKRDMFDPVRNHAVLAVTCLDTFYNIEFGQHKPPQDSLEAYATLFWAVHCQKSASVRTAEGSSLGHRFLSFVGNRGDKTAFNIWSKALTQTIDQLDWFNSLKDKWYESLAMAKDSDEQLSAISLVVGAFNLSEVVPMITDENYDGLDILNRHGRCSLHLAAIYGHEETLNQILAARKLDVNAKDDEGMAPLSWAVQSKNPRVVTRLLATDGLDVNSVDNRGRTALSWAARQDQEEATRLLLQTNKIELNLKDESGRTPLMLAVQNGQVGALRQLLSKEGVDVNCRDKLDWTPLSFSVEGGHEAIVKELLEAEGINVNCADYDGWTPLIFAACEGREEITRLLLAKGVDVNATEDHGRSPLWFAARGGFEGIVRLLICVDGIDLIAMDNLGRTPLLWAVEKRLEGTARPLLEAEGARLDPGGLDWDLLAQAAQKGHEAVVELFCDGQVNPDTSDNSGDWHLVLKPEDVNIRERSGFTPLIRAVSRNEGPLTAYLLSFPNIELNSTDQGGRTALAWAAREGHEKIIDLLLDAQGIDVNAKDNGRRTALQFAAQENHASSVSRLLAYPTTDPNPRDYNGLTPLSWAAMRGHEDVVGLLLATNGIEADTKDNHGLTPLSWASREGRENVVRRIIQVEGVDVNCRDKDGVSPLAWAASRGHESVLAVLLATRRLLVGARDDDGRTALDRATEGDHNKAAELLRRAGEGG